MGTKNTTVLRFLLLSNTFIIFAMIRIIDVLPFHAFPCYA